MDVYANSSILNEVDIESSGYVQTFIGFVWLSTLGLPCAQIYRCFDENIENTAKCYNLCNR